MRLIFLWLGGERIAHVMGLACVNLYFYIPESLITIFEPWSILQEEMIARY